MVALDRFHCITLAHPLYLADHEVLSVEVVDGFVQLPHHFVDLGVGPLTQTLMNLVALRAWNGRKKKNIYIVTPV